MSQQDFASLSMSVSQKGFEEAKKRAQDLAKATRDLVKDIKTLDGTQKTSKKATIQSAEAAEKAAEKKEMWRKEMTRSSGRLKVIGRDINRYLVLPLTAVIGLSSRAALELNRGMSAVQTLIPDATGRIYDLRDGVTSLARESGIAMSDLTDGLYQTISAFQDNKDTMDRLNVASRMARAGFATTTQAVNLLAGVTRAYGDTSAAATDRVSDLAFETVRLGVTTIPHLSGAMQVATDRAVRLNVSQEELFATMATLTGITGDASMVATQFRSAMDSLLNPTEAMNDLLAEMGFASAEAAIDQMGMLDVLIRINEAAEAANRPLQDFITRKEGITLVSRLATQQTGAYIERLDAMTRAQGATNNAVRVAEKGIGEYNFQLNQARQRMNTAAAEVGENMLPSMVALTDTVSDLVVAFSTLPDAMQASLVVFTVIAGFGAMFFQILGVMKSLAVYAFPGVIKQMGIITIAGKTLGTVMAGVSLAVGSIAAAAALVGIAIVRNNRLIEESAREAEDRMTRLESVSERIGRNTFGTDQQRSSRSAMLASGGLPELDGKPVSLEELQKMDESSIQAVVQQYEDLIRTTRSEIQGILGRGLFGMQADLDRSASQIQEYLNDQWLDDVFRIDPSRAQEIKSLFEDDISSVIDDRRIVRVMQDQLNDILDQFTVEQLTGDLPPITRGSGGDVDRSMADLLAARNAYRELKEAVENYENYLATADSLESYNQRMQDLQGNINDVTTALSIIADIDHSAVGEDTALTTWQQWFAQVTEIPEAEYVATGNQAAQLYLNAWTDTIHKEMDIAEFFGITPDKESMLRNRMSQIASDLAELMSNQDIDAPFEFTGDVSLRMLEEYQERLRELSVLQANQFVQSVNDSNAEMEHFNKIVESSGFALDSKSLSMEEHFDRLQTAEQLYVNLIEQGLEPTAEVMIALKDTIEESNEALRETEEILNTMSLSQARSQFISFGDAVGEAFFVSMRDQAQGMETTFLQAFRNIREEANTAFTGMAVMAEFSADVINSTANIAIGKLVSGFTDLGMQLAGANEGARSFSDHMKLMLFEILKMLPPLAMQAGLMLMVNFPHLWPIGLALIGGGILGAIGVGAIQHEMSKGQENAKGNAFVDGSVTAYAKGGILDSPTMFSTSAGPAIAGEAGTEAILPLTRTSDGDLGVKAAPSDGPAVEVYVVNNATGVETRQEESVGDNGARQLKVFIEDVALSAMNSPKGDRIMKSRYGVTTPGARR